MAPRRRLSRPVLLTGVLTLVLALTGAGLWMFARPGTGEGDHAEESEPRVKEPDLSRVRLMLAGDSMTHGADGDKTWRFHLWNHLDPHVEQLDFVGPFSAPATPQQIIPPELVGGEPDEGDPDSVAYRNPDFDQDHNARWGRTLDDAAQTIRADVDRYRPDILCVMIGLNDLLYPISAEQMEQRLRAYVLGARAGNPDIRILIAEAPPISMAENDQGFALRLYVYNELVRSVSEDLSTEQSPVVSFDLAEAEKWDVAADTYDGTHPNAGGELKIAAGFADALSREFGLGPAFARPLPIRPTGSNRV